jgi:ferredoxin-NADP reductase
VLGIEHAPVVLMSAGIGVTPVLAMLHDECAAASGRPLWWVHSARDGGHHPFAAEVRATLARLPDARAFVFFSRAAASDRLGVNYDAEGRLDLLLLQRAGLPLDAVFYFCGPTAYAATLKSDLARLGVPADRIRSVRWSCRTGVCHNCECAVVDGELEYTIEPVDRPPDGRTLLCCAAPKSDVVLEL